MNPEARGPVQMPENVLTEIFHIAMINHSTLPADSKLRSALMGVCRQWRRLIAKNPAFWTFLDFRKAEGMTALDALVMLYEHFERSSVTFFLNLDLSKFKEGELDLQALHYGVTQKTHCCAFLKLVLTTHAQVQQFLPLHSVFSSLSDLWVDIGINPLDPSVNKDFCVFRPAFVTPIQTFGEGFAPVRLKMSIGLGYVVDLGSLNTSRLVSVDVRTQSTMGEYCYDLRRWNANPILLSAICNNGRTARRRRVLWSWRVVDLVRPVFASTPLLVAPGHAILV